MNQYLTIIVLIIILLLVVYNTNFTNNKNKENFKTMEFPVAVKDITELLEKGTDGQSGAQGIQGPRGPRGYPGKNAVSDIGKFIKRKGKNIGIGTNNPEADLELKGLMNMVAHTGTAKTDNQTYTSYYPAGKSNPRYAKVGFNTKNAKDFTILNETESGNTVLKNKNGSVHLNKDGNFKVEKNMGVKGNILFEGDNRWIIHTPPKTKNLHLIPGAKDGRNFDFSKQLSLSNTGNLTTPGKIDASSINTKSNGASINLEGTNHSYMQFFPEGKKKGRKGWFGFGSARDSNITIRNETEKSNINLLTKEGNVGIGTQKPSAKLHVDGAAKVSKNLGVTGDLVFDGDNNWIINTSDERNENDLKIAPKKGSRYDYRKGLKISKSGDVEINGKLTVSGREVFPFLKGMIIAWGGKVNEIPKGWAICDGENGTPDLQGRFVLGSGKGTGLTPRNSGSKGGSEKNKLEVGHIPVHRHYLTHDKWGGGGFGVATDTTKTRFHDGKLVSNNGKVFLSQTYAYHDANSAVRNNPNFEYILHGAKSDRNQYEPTAGLTGKPVNQFGDKMGVGTKSVNNMPPYYTLIYIIKL